MADKVVKSSKVPETFGRLVLAGGSVHYERDRKLLCGCTQEVQAEVLTTWRRGEKGMGSGIDFHFPICRECFELNLKRWSENK